MALGCALINPVGNGDGVREGRWSGGTLLHAEVSLLDGHQKGMTFSPDELLWVPGSPDLKGCCFGY